MWVSCHNTYSSSGGDRRARCCAGGNERTASVKVSKWICKPSASLFSCQQLSVRLSLQLRASFSSSSFMLSAFGSLQSLLWRQTLSFLSHLVLSFCPSFSSCSYLFTNISVMIILLNSPDCVTKLFFSSAGMRRSHSNLFFFCLLSSPPPPITQINHCPSGNSKKLFFFCKRTSMILFSYKPGWHRITLNEFLTGSSHFKSLCPFCEFLSPISCHGRLARRLRSLCAQCEDFLLIFSCKISVDFKWISSWEDGKAAGILLSSLQAFLQSENLP